MVPRKYSLTRPSRNAPTQAISVITCPSRVEAAIATAASTRIAWSTRPNAMINCGLKSTAGL